MSISHQHIVTLLLSVFCLLSTALSARAQSDYWTSVNGPFGGTTVWEMERGTAPSLFAATSNGVFRSLDDGRTWENVSDGLTTFDVRDLLHREDGTLWASTYGGGLYLLSDGAESWTQTSLVNAFTTVLIEPVPGLMIAGSNGFVYRSEDAGLSWTTRSLQGFDVNVQDLSFNAEFVFAATSLGIFRSADLGETWEFSSAGLQEYNVLSIETNEQGNIFAGVNPSQGGCGIYRSRGNGTFWTCVQPPTDPLTVPLLKIGPQGHLYAGGYRNLYETENEGNSWSSRSASGSSVQSVIFLDSAILVGTSGEGIRRSENNGASWTSSSQGLDSQITVVRSLEDGKLVAGTYGGVFVSTNLGESWNRAHEGNPLVQRITDVDLDQDGRMVAATTAGVWRLSEADGWVALGPPGMPSIRDIDIMADGSIAAGYHAGVYFFSGTSWVASPITGTDQASRDVSAVLETENGTILAGASWDGWRRDLSGSGWTLMSSNTAPWFDAQSFAEHNGRLLAGTRFSAVMESYDDGESWHLSGSGLNGSEDVRSVEFDGFGVPHITTYGSGVFQLNPWSRTWLPMNGGLEEHQRVSSIAFDSYGNAFAGTTDGGLFSHIVAGVDTEEQTELPGHLSLAPAYPNPATERVKLPFHLRSPGEVEVEVFDMLGRRVDRFSQYFVSPEAQMSVDTSNFQSGLYLYRVSSRGSSVSGSFSVIN